MKTCPTIPVPQAKNVITNFICYIKDMNHIYEEWWRWRESNPLHQNVYDDMILLNNIRLLKSLMGQFALILETQII